MEIGIGVVFAVLVAAFIGVVLYTGGRCDERDKWEKEAVERGHAEFYLDHNHERQWRWKPTTTITTDFGVRIANPDAKVKVREA